MRKVFSRRSSVFLSIAVLVASGFLMSAGTASAIDQLPYITYNGSNLYIFPTDSSSAIVWGGSGITTGATSMTDGATNTATIVSALGVGSDFAAGLCSNLNFDGYSDWYLPAFDQLFAMYNARNTVTKGDYSGTWADFAPNIYWSSYDTYPLYAGITRFSDGAQFSDFKTNPNYVRCVRSASSDASLISVDEPDRARDISWKAEKYTDSNKSCSERLKLTIKGKNFDKDAEVSIGGKEASSVNVKNSKKLTAKFCLEKLLNDKVDQKRKVTVKNPDTEKEEADKQIDLGDLTSGNEVAVGNNTSAQTSSTGDYDQKTKEGAKQIQEALNKLGYLDGENITSTFGSITMEAVKKFQSDNGIEATGFVGELTKAKLAEKLK